MCICGASQARGTLKERSFFGANMNFKEKKTFRASVFKIIFILSFNKRENAPPPLAAWCMWLRPDQSLSAYTDR